ncbi:hypothetical protein QFC22_005848 [Naganishia vaughanmartiniae]|uniref:Uncharacterized protein n=1 Tax=Naganishia vaughanmartiniae TaxID=1424756 RepID=A0ACC2WRC4_9TREE|nr:hypothetical protein QFC22_005848 [Naganishia vaughanmartiniae]
MEGYSHFPGLGSSLDINEEQPPENPFEESQPALLTPNTQTLLQDFFNMPSPAMEVAPEIATETAAFQSTDNVFNQVALLPYAHPASHITRSGSVEASFGSIQQSFPLYQFPTLFPTGLNLSSPAPPDSLNFSQMCSSMDPEAMAYHFSLPINLTKPEEFSAIPQIEQDRQQTPLDPTTSSGDAGPPPKPPQTEFEPGWFPAVGLLDAGRRAKDPIDVPPFVREKLLRSFFYNLNRCPCCHVDRDRFEQRLRLTPEERPHPAWLFSMYLMGAIWLQEPSITSMESHFYSVAKDQLDSGLAKRDRSLDLIRAGANLAIYLVQRNREQESLSRACGLHVPRAKRDSELNRLALESRPLRQVMCRLELPRDDTEIMERLHTWASIHGLDTYGVLVGGRPPSIEGHLTAPVHYIPASGANVGSRILVVD